MDKNILILRIVKDIETLGNSIKALADAIKEEDSKDKPHIDKKQIVTLEEVRKVLVDKSRAGLTDEVRTLLKKYGADRLSKVDPSHYADLMKDAEVI